MTFHEWIDEIITIDKRYKPLKDIAFILERRSFLKYYKAGLTPKETLEKKIKKG